MEYACAALSQNQTKESFIILLPRSPGQFINVICDIERFSGKIRPYIPALLLLDTSAPRFFGSGSIAGTKDSDFEESAIFKAE